VIDPNNPDTVYAAAYQRRRHVWSFINGGPESAIHKSTDAGATWNKIRAGLPNVEMGRIGLTISPVDTNVLYATIEAADGRGGIFRSRIAEAVGRDAIPTIQRNVLFPDYRRSERG
jgi:hypothetical protein